MYRFIKAIITFVCLIGFSVQADEPVPQSLEELKTAIEKIRQDTNTPALGIALVNKDGPYWIAGLGEANIETHTKADENTLFRIGSVSKMFAALAVLKLQEEGKLNLNDKVRDLVPEIQFENPWEETHPIKVVHLLEHTTGWDDIHLAEYAFSAPDTMSTKEGLDYHPDSRKSRWIPGTRHAYCNAGAAVVAYIVEKITGKKYEDYIEDTFFKPLDMQSTSYFQTDLYQQKGATLYTNNKPENYWHIIHRAAGSINSSPKDMANFVQFLLLRGATPSQQIVSSTAIDRMETPETTLGNLSGIKSGYGLANYTSGHKDFHIAFRGHNGGVFGGLTELSYNNELGTGYVFMINAGNWLAFDKISKTIRAYLLKNHKVNKPQPIALPEKFKSLGGYYVPINHRNQLMRLMNVTFGVMKFQTDDTYLHRHPLLGGWEHPSQDYATNEDYLIDSWTGLPSIALVDDPIEGNAIQVNTDLFKPASALQVFGMIGLYAALLITTLCSLLAIVIWGFRRLAKKTPADPSVWIRIWPLAASLIFIGFAVSLSLGGLFIQSFANISPLSITIFLLSITYPIVSIASAVILFKYRQHSISSWIFWYAFIYTGLNLLMATHLAYYGLFALKTWS
ncbi:MULTISPECIES: serine hydrolase domain-containing protein [Cellvibrio]|uniref:CubicO group peptidase (Beta-lactamase class C family) n=1 Tax=Cellvibrio fibrivorans TaxID=126350 RepID=A0ABU1UV84_9GAMM|nr:serine hydrolase domain-containing protein [Cellvibrio fibrivorans]MDR7089086.1 CubicO group peptidase (beta-lactamase class C family) [Cellvibrio fibrivorans]